VKVNESVPEEGPPSSLSVDESFVVLERSPPQELNNQFASFMSEQSTVYPAVSPHNTFTGGITCMESQVSIVLHCAVFLHPQVFLEGVRNVRIVMPRIQRLHFRFPAGASFILWLFRFVHAFAICKTSSEFRTMCVSNASIQKVTC